MSVEPVRRSTEYGHMLILRKLRDTVTEQKSENASRGSAGSRGSSMVDPARTAIRQLELLRMEQVQTEEMQQVADIWVAHADALRRARE